MAGVEVGTWIETTVTLLFGWPWALLAQCGVQL
jgi:hypothetical protein